MNQQQQQQATPLQNQAVEDLPADNNGATYGAMAGQNMPTADQNEHKAGNRVNQLRTSGHTRSPAPIDFTRDNAYKQGEELSAERDEGVIQLHSRSPSGLGIVVDDVAYLNRNNESFGQHRKQRNVVGSSTGPTTLAALTNQSSGPHSSINFKMKKKSQHGLAQSTSGTNNNTNRNTQRDLANLSYGRGPQVETRKSFKDYQTHNTSLNMGNNMLAAGAPGMNNHYGDLMVLPNLSGTGSNLPMVPPVQNSTIGQGPIQQQTQSFEDAKVMPLSGHNQTRHRQSQHREHRGQTMRNQKGAHLSMDRAQNHTSSVAGAASIYSAGNGTGKGSNQVSRFRGHATDKNNQQVQSFLPGSNNFNSVGDTPRDENSDSKLGQRPQKIISKYASNVELKNQPITNKSLVLANGQNSEQIQSQGYNNQMMGGRQRVSESLGSNDMRQNLAPPIGQQLKSDRDIFSGKGKMQSMGRVQSKQKQQQRTANHFNSQGLEVGNSQIGGGYSAYKNGFGVKNDPTNVAPINVANGPQSFKGGPILNNNQSISADMTKRTNGSNGGGQSQRGNNNQAVNQIGVLSSHQMTTNQKGQMIRGKSRGGNGTIPATTGGQIQNRYTIGSSTITSGQQNIQPPNLQSGQRIERKSQESRRGHQQLNSQNYLNPGEEGMLSEPQLDQPSVNRQQHGNSPGFSSRRRVPRDIPFEDPSPQTRYYSNDQNNKNDLKIPGIGKQQNSSKAYRNTLKPLVQSQKQAVNGNRMLPLKVQHAAGAIEEQSRSQDKLQIEGNQNAISSGYQSLAIQSQNQGQFHSQNINSTSNDIASQNSGSFVGGSRVIDLSLNEKLSRQRAGAAHRSQNSHNNEGRSSPQQFEQVAKKNTTVDQSNRTGTQAQGGRTKGQSRNSQNRRLIVHSQGQLNGSIDGLSKHLESSPRQDRQHGLSGNTQVNRVSLAEINSRHQNNSQRDAQSLTRFRQAASNSNQASVDTNQSTFDKVNLTADARQIRKDQQNQHHLQQRSLRSGHSQPFSNGTKDEGSNDVRMKYFNNSGQMAQGQATMPNSQESYSGSRYLKQFQTSEGRAQGVKPQSMNSSLIQVNNNHVNQQMNLQVSHRLSAGQLLRPIDHQHNPYTDNNTTTLNESLERIQPERLPGAPSSEMMNTNAASGQVQGLTRSQMRARRQGARNQGNSHTLPGSSDPQLINSSAANQGSEQKPSLTMMRQKGQSQPDLPTFPLPGSNKSVDNEGSSLEASGQLDSGSFNDQIGSSEKKGVVDPVKASPVPAATKAVDDPQLSTRYEQLNNSTSSSGRHNAKGQSPKTAQQIQNLNKNQGNSGITMGPGAAAPLGIPGITQPYQLLKYSAISRCGMVLKQVLTSSGDGSQKNQSQKYQQMLTPKINQDSFKVIKAFPQETKPFNWLFGVFDGHGPHGEIMSQFAAEQVPIVLDKKLKDIWTKYMPTIQSLQQEIIKQKQMSTPSSKGSPNRHLNGQISNHEVQKMQEKLQQMTQERDAEVDQEITNAFESVDVDMRKQFGPNQTEKDRGAEFGSQDLVELSGCTGTLILVQEDYFVIGNAGDSPVVLFREETVKGQSRQGGRFVGEQMSVDHKPDMPEESERILKVGGVLDQFESQVTGKKVGPMRVWSKDVRQPGLAMSRSLGDNMAKKCGVVATPTVKILKRDRTKDRAIIVCSDGISDQISAAEMAETVEFFYKRQQDTENCCKQLVEIATQRWHQKHNMQDDITCIVMFLR